MIIILSIILSYMKHINLVYNVKSNKQFLISTRTTWTDLTRPANICKFSDPTRPNPTRPSGQPDTRATLYSRVTQTDGHRISLP